MPEHPTITVKVELPQILAADGDPAMKVLGDVIRERGSQVEKWGEQLEHSDSFWTVILVEEVGEAAAETWGMAYDEVTPEATRALYFEVVQCAAVAVAWAESLRKRRPECFG